jgi:hypothetical protein
LASQRDVTDLEQLDRPQLLGLFARTRDAPTRRAIQRRLQQIDDQPAPPPVRKAPPMQELDFRHSVRRLLPPTTRTWWSLAQVTEALDRATAEHHERRGKE